MKIVDQVTTNHLRKTVNLGNGLNSNIRRGELPLTKTFDQSKSNSDLTEKPYWGNYWKLCAADEVFTGSITERRAKSSAGTFRTRLDFPRTDPITPGIKISGLLLGKISGSLDVRPKLQLRCNSLVNSWFTVSSVLVKNMVTIRWNII